MLTYNMLVKEIEELHEWESSPFNTGFYVDSERQNLADRFGMTKEEIVEMIVRIYGD